MPYHYVSTEALCPFYRYEEPTAVYCEGVDEGSTIKLYYGKGRKTLDIYKAQHCRKDWESCPIAAMLISKNNLQIP